MWIEIFVCIFVAVDFKVTPYAGVWIEIDEVKAQKRFRKGHSLRGSVDWNFIMDLEIYLHIVTPYAGVWIEIE